jgi:RNA polymerase sigma-70 factor (ECF subfamily)
MNSDEETRLKQARVLDRATLTAIYDDYYEPVYRYVYRQIGEVDLARDLTSDVFQRFLHALHTGRGPTENLKAWLYQTAHNIVIDHYRRQQHRQHVSLDEELPHADADPVRLAEAHLSAQTVRAALRQLTPDQQQVIALKFLEGLSNQETAEALDKPVSAVKSLQHRALSALQRILDPLREKTSL